MPAQRTNESYSVWGYFGYGRPLFGFILSVFVSLIFIAIGFPYFAILFAILSLFFLIIVYNTCKNHRREALLTEASSDRNYGINNQAFFELTATALARDHRSVPGSFPMRGSQSSSSVSNEIISDEPPDYFEATGLPKGSASGRTSTPAHVGDKIEGSPEALPSPSPGGENNSSSPSGIMIIGVHDPTLYRLPSYDEAVASTDHLADSVENSRY